MWGLIESESDGQVNDFSDTMEREVVGQIHIALVQLIRVK